MDDQLASAERRLIALNLEAPKSHPVRPVEDLRQIALDQLARAEDRRAALAELVIRWAGESALSELVDTLLDDPDLMADAIASAPPFDGRILARLRGLLNDPRASVWEAAALALARKKDHSVLPLMVDWVRRGDNPHRRVGFAAVAFLLTPEPHLAFVESICECGPLDDEDESVLVEALRLAESRVEFWRRALQRVQP